MTAMRIVLLALGCILGIVAATILRQPVPAAIAFGALACGVALSAYLVAREWRWREWNRGVVALAALLCTFPIGYWRTAEELGPARPDTIRAILSQVPVGTPIGLRGRINREPELRTATQGDIRVRADEIRVGEDGEWRRAGTGDVLLRVYVVRRSTDEAAAQRDELLDPEAYGYRVEVDARHRPVDATLNPAEFDFGGFLQQQGLVASLRCHVSRVTILDRAAGHPLMELALAAKRHFLATFRQTIRAPASRLVAAATLGTRRAVDGVAYRGKDITQAFRHAGVGHVLAVSGLHVSVISVLLFWLFKVTGLRPKVFVPALILFLVLFALLTGARPSSVRAVVMNAVIMVAFAYFHCGFRQATYVGLALSSLVILLASPMVLYAASFLLSYGAVLSLVIISPPLDRWLRRLRGFALLFAGLWFALLIAICAVNLEFLLNPSHALGLVGLLWMLILTGGRLNDHRPTAWQFGLERLPRGLRMFVSAQLAIQFGMMLPLSSWFFGQFPVAGVFVNLLAIPAIAVLVQFGIMVGLLGLIPVWGRWIALPFGVTDTLVGEFFLRMAQVASNVFPFPATPRPSLGWMIGYYILLGIVLSSGFWKVRAQTLLYRAWPCIARGGAGELAPFLLPLLCMAPTLGTLVPTAPECVGLTCLADGRAPLITIVSGQRHAVTINAGEARTGERLLFETLREQGAVSVDTAIVAGFNPRAGLDGLAALSRKMIVRQALLPVVSADPHRYLAAIGDARLTEAAANGDAWATAYEDAYTALVETVAARGMPLRAIPNGELVAWDNVRVTALPLPRYIPARFSTSARTRVLEIVFDSSRWLIITEARSETLRAVLRADARPCDVLILPETSSRSDFEALIDTAVERARPRVVILTGDELPRDFDMDAWAARHGTFQLFMTARDGAITAVPARDGAVRLSAFVSGREAIVGGR